jgi:hypothetical protein
MGQIASNEPDTARGRVVGTFAATGNSGDVVVNGALNVSIWGTFVGTVKPRRSFDGGTTWLYVSKPDLTGDITITSPASFQLFEFEDGVLYDLECTAYTSGPVNYRLSI